MVRTTRFLLVALLITGLLMLLYRSQGVSYMQNDEYINYQVVHNFSEGNFKLEEYLAPNFYTQGLLAVTFSKLFGITRLPLLTAFLAVCTIYVFIRLLYEKLHLSTNTAILMALLLFVNPLFIYSSLGFMTEIYFLFFLMLGVFYIYTFEETRNIRHFLIANALLLLGFFVRQHGIVVFVAWSITLLLQKKYKYGLGQVFITTILTFYYLRLFPLTQQMRANTLDFSNLTNFIHTFSLAYAVLIYLAVFTFPLLANFYIEEVKTNNRRAVLLTILSAAIVLFALNFFTATSIRHTSVLADGTRNVQYSSGRFPYLPNVFNENGYLTESLQGKKYAFYGGTGLFMVLDKLGKIFSVLAIVFLLGKSGRKLNFESIFIISYLTLLIVSPKVYDRYLVILVPFVILFFSRIAGTFSIYLKAFLVLYIALFGFISYQFIQDFYYTNSYVWSKSKELHQTLGVAENKIRGGNSWYHLYPNPKRDWMYTFRYSLPEDIKNGAVTERQTIKYPLNTFIKPVVFLVK